MSAVYNEFIEAILNGCIDFKNFNDISNVDVYFEKIRANILSEIVAIVKNGKYEKYKCKWIDNKTLKLPHFIDKNIVNSYILINDSCHFITKYDYYDKFLFAKISIYPSIVNKIDTSKTITISMLNNTIGDKLHQYSSMIQIKRHINNYAPILDSLTDPSIYTLGDYSFNNVACNEINKDQHNAIQSLKYNIEIIHGPPGTGKSTTITNIILSRIPTDHLILCTGVQNQAIESIVCKCVKNNIKFVVIGEESRLKTESKKHLLSAKFDQNDTITKATSKIKQINNEIEFMDNTCHIMENDKIKEHEKEIKILEQIINNEKQKITSNIKIVISTISSSHKIFNTINRKIDTIIIDEAGVVTEMNILPLLRSLPKNIIFIGDHKQLHAFNYSHASNTHIQYYISPMERMLMSNRKHYILCTQYRMQNNICNLVSSLFYNNCLITDKSIIPQKKQSQ